MPNSPSEFDFRLRPSSPFPQVFQKLKERLGGTDWEIHVGPRRPLRFRHRRRED